MKSGRSSVSLGDAQRIILDYVTPLSGESISILESVNRVLYDDIVSDVMIPPLDCSARDGYAIIAEDTWVASRNSPVKLKIVGEIQAGGSSSGKQVSRGAAIRIMTGAPMPEGADAVVQFEDTEEKDDAVKLFCKIDKYDNYRKAGDNIKTDDRVLHRGDRLNPADLGILASLNYNTIRVYRQPTVSIVSTGDELAGLGEEIEFGKIRDVNAFALYAEVKKYNALPKYLGIAKDTLKDVKGKISSALNSDVTISTGGGSMGKYDFVREVYADLNIQMQFERVNVKPGKPCAFGTKDNKLIFSLPGNPVSAMTSFIQFVRPALLSLMGAKRISIPIVSAFIQEEISKKQTNNVRLLRGRFTIKNNEFHVSTMGDKKPSIFQSMRDANCLIIVPENVVKIAAGERVAIQLIYHDEI